MKTKTKLLISAAALMTIAGLAYGTAVINLAAGVIGQGTHTAWMDAHGVAKMQDGNYFNAYLKTEGPASITTTLADYTAGGQNGWHKHPGMVIVTLTKGTIQWYDANCNLTIYKAGDFWVEGSQLHFLRVLGAETTQFVSTFIVAEGEPNRIDQPAPPCAAALGLK